MLTVVGMRREGKHKRRRAELATCNWEAGGTQAIASA